MSEDKSDDQAQDDEPAPRSLYDTLKVPAVMVAVLALIGTLFKDPIADVTHALLNRFNPNAGQGEEAPETLLISFMKRNWDCTKVPGQFTELPNDVRIAAAICGATGDIYFEFHYSENGEPRKKLGGILLQETLQDNGKGIVVADARPPLAPVGADFGQRLASLLVSPAHAHPFEPDAPDPNQHPIPTALLAQSTLPVVQCQSFPADGTIVRKVRQGHSCFMEVINGQTGVVINSFSVPCDRPCP